MIVVTGATGNIGSRLVRQLVAGEARVRAFVRDRAKAAVLGEGVELAVGDFSDPDSIRIAVRGAEVVVVSSGNHPLQVQHEANVFDSVVATGGQRVVKISSVGAHAGSPASFVDWHHRSEERLARSGLPATVLRCNFFMSNLFASAPTIMESGVLAAPAGGAAIAMVDPRDVAAAAVAVVTDPRHDAPSYELTGPEALGYDQVAARLSPVAGRPVQFVDVPDRVAREGMVRAGLPDWFADGLIGLFAVLREGIASRTTGTVEALTGRAPRSLGEFLQDHAEVFHGPGLPARPSR